MHHAQFISSSCLFFLLLIFLYLLERPEFALYAQKFIHNASLTPTLSVNPSE
jgi:hypothetical protein